MNDNLTGWHYYNHALMPDTTPNENPDTTPLFDKKIWKDNKKALLARWTTNFDCKEEKGWWYVIKDTPFNIMDLKSSYRYKINKGAKNFDVKVIDPLEYIEQIIDVQEKAFAVYPAKYRPTVDREASRKEINTEWKDCIVYGCFFRSNNEFCGYALLSKKRNCILFIALKVDPNYEKLQINAAIINGFLNDYSEFLNGEGYICDGEKNILHETHFQDYLEKYFNFRKAYCQLNVKYRKGLKPLVKILYPFSKILIKLDNVGIIHKINGVLKMESIIKEDSKREI